MPRILANVRISSPDGVTNLTLTINPITLEEFFFKNSDNCVTVYHPCSIDDRLAATTRYTFGYSRPWL